MSAQPQPAVSSRAWWYSTPFLILGVLWIAANLRGPMTGVSPLLASIQATFDLTTVQVGFITTLPLLAMAVVSPLAATVAGRIGIERALMLGLLFIGGGIVLRSLGPLWCVYAGMGSIGMGIAFGNVLLPGLLKSRFPQHIAALTGAYAITMGIGAALMSAAMVPLAIGAGLGWSNALLLMVLMPLAGILIWLPQTRHHDAAAARKAAADRPRLALWRVPLAWQVSLFIAINSALYYVLIGWLPALLTGAGYSAEAAGTWHGIMQFMAGLPGLVLAPVLRRLRNQQAIAALVSLIVAVCLIGLWAAPAWSGFWVAAFGTASGAGMILGLVLVALRSTSPLQAAALAGMAQSTAYWLAAAGPPGMGWIFERSGGWGLPLWLCAGAALVMAGCGWLAGRNRLVGDASA